MNPALHRLRVPLLVVAVLLPAALTLAPAPRAHAAVFEVTRRDDPNPNGCRPSNCSLREAVIAANNRSGPDVIELKAKNYKLERAGTVEDASVTGDLDISSKVTIVGRGAARTSVNANDLDRAFHVLPGGRATFKRMLITNGTSEFLSDVGTGGGLANQGRARLVNARVENNNAPAGAGGGIANAGRLVIANTRVSNNSVGSGDCCGGGIYSYGGKVSIRNSRVLGNDGGGCCGSGLNVENGAEVSIVGSTFSNNDLDGCCGGAIYSQNNVTMTIKRSKFLGHNTAGCCGAVIYNQNDSTIEIDRSRFVNNPLGGCCGGAIYNQNDSTIHIDRSRFVRHKTLAGCCGGTFYNQVDSTLTLDRTDVIRSKVMGGCCGGAIYNQSPDSKMSIKRSVIDVNRVSGGCCGGAIYNQEAAEMRIVRSKITDSRVVGAGCCGGAIYNHDGAPLFIRYTLIRDARVSTDTGNTGGAIHLQTSDGADYVIRDSTIADSVAYRGGGIYNNSALELLNVTISGNEAVENGGGIYSDTSETVSMKHVTVTGNEAGGAASGIYGVGGSTTILRSIVAGNEGTDDCNLVLSNALNLDQDEECFDGAEAIHAPPKLKPLDNNGGPTPTHALRAASEAVDAVAAASCPPPARDQRGVVRPQNGDGQGGARCDLGAFELKP